VAPLPGPSPAVGSAAPNRPNKASMPAAAPTAAESSDRTGGGTAAPPADCTGVASGPGAAPRATGVDARRRWAAEVPAAGPVAASWGGPDGTPAPCVSDGDVGSDGDRWGRGWLPALSPPGKQKQGQGRQWAAGCGWKRAVPGGAGGGHRKAPQYARGEQPHPPCTPHAPHPAGTHARHTVTRLWLHEATARSRRAGQGKAQARPRDPPTAPPPRARGQGPRHTTMTGHRTHHGPHVASRQSHFQMHTKR
jgi:hypothetical protein